MKLKKEYICRKVAGTWVVMEIGAKSINADTVLVLNDTGALLWKHLAEGASRESMAQALVTEYEIDQTIALRDVENFIEAMHKLNCID